MDESLLDRIYKADTVLVVGVTFLEPRFASEQQEEVPPLDMHVSKDKVMFMYNW